MLLGKEMRLGRHGREGLLHERPGAAAQIAFPNEDAAPAQGGEQALRAGVVGPELGQMGARLDGPLLKGGKETVGVSPVRMRGLDSVDIVYS